MRRIMRMPGRGASIFRVVLGHNESRLSPKTGHMTLTSHYSSIVQRHTQPGRVVQCVGGSQPGTPVVYHHDYHQAVRARHGMAARGCEMAIAKRYVGDVVGSRQRAMQLDASNTEQVMSRYDTLLIDCDGVLWHTDHFTKMAGISEAIARLQNRDKQLYFVTNNSLRARDAYLQMFKEYAGFEAGKAHVFSVAYAAALYLKDIAKIKGKCYLVGSEGMAQELEEVGIPYLGYGPDVDKASIHPEDLMAMYLDPAVEVVLVGFDHHFSYTKLFKAASYLSDPTCHYVATNDLERTLKLSPRHCQPLTGVLVTAINAATSRDPLVIGKPYAHLLEVILAQFPSLDLTRTLMVGDSIKTDMGFAQTIGVDSLLVMTGSTTLEHLRKYEQLQKNVPTYYMDSFGKFGKYL